MKQLRWSAESRWDIERIRDFYPDSDTEHFAAIAGEIVKAARFIAERPNAGPKINGRGHRKWPVKRFPYMILYRVTETELRVVRVVHAASDWTSLF